LPTTVVGVDRILTVSNAGNVKHGVKVFQGIKTSVIAERTFGPKFVQAHIAFEDDLCIGGNFQVDGFAHFTKSTGS